MNVQNKAELKLQTASSLGYPHWTIQNVEVPDWTVPGLPGDEERGHL